MGCAVSYEKTNKKLKDASAFHSPNTTRRLIEKTPVSPISASSGFKSPDARSPWSPSATPTHVALSSTSSSLSCPRGPLSPTFSSSYTDQELRAYSDAYLQLVNDGWMNKISERELILSVMNCKLDVSLAVTKYKNWLNALKEVGFDSFEDIWRGISSDGISGGEWKNLAPFFSRYAACGHDIHGRIVLWVKWQNDPIVPEDEGKFVRAVFTYFVALQSNIKTMREGITLVIDTSEKTKVHGNEKKLRKIINKMPARPQKIFILGAGYIKRMIINAAIKIISAVATDKISKRVKFADLDDIRKEISHDSLPQYVGGGYRIKDNDQLLAWARFKLGEFSPLKVELENSSHRNQGKIRNENAKRPSANTALSYPCGSSYCIYCAASGTFSSVDNKSSRNQSKTGSASNSRCLWIFSLVIAICVYAILYYLYSSSQFSLSSTSENYPFKDDIDMVDRFMTSSSSSNLIVEPEHMCVSSIEKRCTLVVSIGSIVNNSLSRMGGTRHWYHLLQKVLPSLGEAHDNVWSSKARSRFASNEDIYIVFEEESSVKNLNPFGRFVLMSLLTGGKFSRVHFAYYINDSARQLLQVIFSVDQAQQGVDELFVISASSSESISLEIDSNVEEILHVNLVAPRTKFHWFLKKKALLQFRESYQALCNIRTGTVDVLYNHTKVDNLGKSNFHDSTLDVLANSVIDIENDESSFNVFKSSKLMKLKPSAVDTSLRNIVVYQRDKGRYIQDIDMVWAKLTGQTTGWEVKVLHHNESTAPCRLIQSVSTATIMLTSHGFQSILLLYQPWASMLAEVHTHMLYIPHFYGELQICLRQQFGLARSYFSEESVPTREFPSLLSKLGIENGESCKNRKYCRHLSKKQDVIVSDRFLNRIENFLKGYFVETIYPEHDKDDDDSVGDNNRVMESEGGKDNEQERAKIRSNSDL